MRRSTRNLGISATLGLATWLVPGAALAQQPGPEAPDPGPAPDAAAAPTAGADDDSVPTVADTPLPPGAEDIVKQFDAVVAQAGGLTSDQVAAQAVATNWTIKSREKDQEIADLNVDQAVAAYLPEVRLIARYTRLSPVENGSFGGGGAPDTYLAFADAPGPLDANNTLTGVPISQLTSGFEFPVFLNNYHLQASVNVPISDYVLRAGHGLRAAKHNKRFAKLNREAEVLHTAANAKLVYYNWVQAELNLVIVEQSRALAEERLRVAKAGFAGGRLSKVDVLNAESGLARAELMSSQMRNVATLAKDQVRTIMHDTTPRDYAVGEDVMRKPIPARTVESFDQLYEEAQQKRLEFEAFELSQKSLEEAANTVRADNYPRLAAFGNAYYMNPSQRVFPQEDKFRAHWDVGLELTWTPTRIANSRAESRKYEVQAAQRDSDIQNLRDGLRAEVMQARQKMIEAALNIETSERGLAAAEEGYRVSRKLYEYGRATSVEVTDAENKLLTARLAVVNAHVDLITAQIRLEHAVGRDVGQQP